MKGILIDVEKEVSQVVEFEDRLEVYYELLNTDIIAIPDRTIGKRDKRYNIVCDEEAALKANPKVSAINDMGKIMLLGNILICGGTDEDGNLLGLTDRDIEYIQKYIVNVSTRNYPKGYPMLTQCEYY